MVERRPAPTACRRLEEPIALSPGRMKAMLAQRKADPSANRVELSESSSA
jgi:hypothetical protein